LNRTAPKQRTVAKIRPRQRDADSQSIGASSQSDISPGLRRYVYVTAALTGAAVLIIEILGAKMLAPYVGTSHFVWTAQIAVTLMALATGYALGGWVADRSAQLRHLYMALVPAALWLCGAAWACEPVALASLRFRLALGSLLASAILFFVPLALLAMVGPLAVRWLTSSVSCVGQQVGVLSAVSTLGSVGGTVLIAYVLIPYLANSSILYITASYLLVLSAGYFLIWKRRGRMMALTGATAAILLIAEGSSHQQLHWSAPLKELFRANSNFGLVQVVQAEGARPRRYLFNDLLAQNIYDPVQHVSAASFTYAEDGLIRAYTSEDVHDVLCIGLGAGITPMRMARAGVRVDVVEINPAMIIVAERFFDFHPDRVRVVTGDGRYFLHEGTKRYDAIILDAFLGESPPTHLMSREAFQSMQRRLRPKGLLVINSFGELKPGKDFVPASLDKTLKSVFRNVRLHVARGAGYFVASDSLDLRMVRHLDLPSIPADLRNKLQEALENVKTPDPAHGMVLTDNYNPVEYWDAAYREALRRRTLGAD
jgi:predicted membrane-bound spermidine synthase